MGERAALPWCVGEPLCQIGMSWLSEPPGREDYLMSQAWGDDPEGEDGAEDDGGYAIPPTDDPEGEDDDERIPEYAWAPTRRKIFVLSLINKLHAVLRSSGPSVVRFRTPSPKRPRSGFG